MSGKARPITRHVPEGTLTRYDRRPILYEGEEERLAAALHDELLDCDSRSDPRPGNPYADADAHREYHQTDADNLIERLSAGSAEPDEPSGREGR